MVMTAPTTNISFSSIQTELGGSNPIALSEYYRGGSIVNTNQTSPIGTIPTSSQINVGVFRNVTKYIPVFTATIGSNQTDLNLRTWAVANGWDGSKPATITIGSGVYVYATTTAGAGLTINGSWPGGITVINNGYIMGMGGSGESASTNYYQRISPGNGGPAISLGLSCTIQNNSYIGGGGGGGAICYSAAGGGGAGGGAGGYFSPGFYGSGSADSPGGAGGGPGSLGGNGGPAVQLNWKYSTDQYSGGGGGGRIMPGAGGAGGSYLGTLAEMGGRGGGAGGGGGAFYGSGIGGEDGGAGGSGGNIGNSPPSGFNGLSAAGGGGWGAYGGAGMTVDQSHISIGGSGGQAVALNGYSVTWSATGTRYGAIS